MTIFSWVLNASQKTGLISRLYPSRRQVGGIWGPPGTGKTVIAAIEAVHACTEFDEKVLVCAFQNAAVDQTLRYIIRLLNEKGRTSMDIVRRVGYEAAVSTDLLPYYKSSVRLENAKIIGSTLHSSMTAEVASRQGPSRIVMDESGQVKPEHSFMALKLARGADIVLTTYGDDVQINPISPDFVRERGVLNFLRRNEPRAVNMLDLTYRLVEPCVDMTSQIFYNGQLDAPPEVRNRRLVFPNESTGKWKKIVNPPLVYVGVDGNEEEIGFSENKSFQNRAHSQLAASLCQEFIRMGVQPENIALIAPYRAQVRCNEIALGEVPVQPVTVHQMQGQEKDIVIFTLTRSNNDLGFMRREPEILNVATSRQRQNLIIIGPANETFSEGSPESKLMFDFIEKHGEIVWI